MTKYKSIGGKYRVKTSKKGNVILKNDTAKLTLKPEVLKSLMEWLTSGNKKEE